MGHQIDLTKAFDKINVKILIDKLLQTTLPQAITRIIQFMLNNSYVNVRYNDFIGSEFLIKNGTRQGGILSATLFNFYINECLDEVSNMNIGCKLSNIKANILAYADDLIFLSPTSKGLQNIINMVDKILKKLCLVVNTSKSFYITFKARQSLDHNHIIKLSGATLEKTSEIKYLGVILSENMSLKNEIGKATKAFLKQFNGFYSKYNFLDSEILYFLFRTYTSSFYGSNLWFEQNLTTNGLRNISVTYHKAVKRTAGLKTWDNNHDACNIVNVNIFRHLVAKRMLNHFFNIINSKNSTFRSLRYFFMFDSKIKSCMDNIFSNWYNVQEFMHNDRSALISRINYVERTEPRSNYNVNVE